MVTTVKTDVKKISPDEYRKQEELSEIRHEYRDGVIVPMTGGSANHSRIITDLCNLLLNALGVDECEIFNSDLRVWIPDYNRGTYPDVMVVKGDLDFNGNRPDEVLNPSLMVEVLSPSTENYDRGTKFYLYRSIPSFCEYLLIDQSRPCIDNYWKYDNDEWRLKEIQGLDKTVDLKHVPVKSSLSEIYRRVNFED
ncbi:MAG: Uma2 family endonuclease [Cyanobacteria bacterium P01_D01_bin.73]